MNDFKVMAKILTAVKVCEHERKMNPVLFDIKVLKTDEATRDSIVVKLQEDGYVDGFLIVDDIDNQAYPAVMYNTSNPKITIKGLTFIEENKPLKKAIEELKNIVLSAASDTLSNAALWW